jgi:hypothetical protein
MTTALSLLLPQLTIHNNSAANENECPNESVELNAEIEREIAHKNSIAEAYARGFTEGQTASKSESSSEIEQLSARHELDQGSKLAEHIDLAFGAVKAELNELLYKAVMPFVRRSISSNALVEIEELLASALGDDEKPELSVSGPKQLVAHLKDRLAARNFKINISAKDSFEVQANFDAGAMTTRIGEWLNKIEQLG